MKKFDFHPGYYHICQLSADKGIIFYSTADILVYYSIIAVRCLKEDIRPIGFTVMFNHSHLEAPFQTEKQMSSFMNSTGTTFVRGYNSHYNLSGPVFHRAYNRSSKYGDKKVRDTFVYIGNNGKEKLPSIKAEDYKYNFIKYLSSSHPFSEEIDFRIASPELLFLLGEVMKRRRNYQPLNYSLFGKEYEKISEKERLQLTDFIIYAYFFLDKEKIISLYGSYENVLTAMNAVSGSEHDFKDDSSKENYRHYFQMIALCKRMGYDVSKHRLIAPQVEGLLASTLGNWVRVKPFSTSTLVTVIAKQTPPSGPIVLPEKEFIKLISAMRFEVGASDYEIAKFFHLL
ncbi:MAG: hypothetical protein K5909_05780 [Bacteroidales bacterium]|nr:hypothetical protein [Bacteroidales bacterium]